MIVFGVICILLAFAAGAASIGLATTVYQQIYFILGAIFWLLVALLVQSASDKSSVVKAIQRIEAQLVALNAEDDDAAGAPCPKCGTPTSADMAYCIHCGEALRV